MMVAVDDVDTALGDRTLGGGGMVAKLLCRAEVVVIDVDTALGDRTLRGGGGMVAKLDGASMVTVGLWSSTQTWRLEVKRWVECSDKLL